MRINRIRKVFVGCIKIVLMLTRRKDIAKILLALESGTFQPNVKRGGTNEIVILEQAIVRTGRQVRVSVRLF